ncbi:L7Ae/L30e/S12e/Gadd45 family ribosomal protein [Lentilactobacillus sp. SPB1-3]|uniref:L7Ae/L30e/S12e/Gadd45 family ribosomal protein n=1 Tax=Lentilactobacillus terminaliae TaxID=3003483 RepID=A0ACD5DCF5_9LACO|nr:ribosomal L7Ae/L30e/S12e/Gadd45 family protein [Lentilactobacillus sp. SPB1-3]MCZ0977306.1 ribosomal L7Ae/L30e/S12e/Gadd45 family protein [Lentilactobacillus sp. SPB1-3]
MDNKQALINFLGLAQRARKTVSGQEILLKELRANNLKFLFIASDSGKDTFKKFTDKSTTYNVPTNVLLTSEELSNAVGVKRSIIGISDSGMAKKMIELTKQSKGE